jgi:hypothetical protein
VPEARLGGPIALVRDGDKIVIDSEKRTIDWDVSEEEQARRRAEWEGSGKGELTVKRGILLRYARDVAVRDAFQLQRQMIPAKIRYAYFRLIARKCGVLLRLVWYIYESRKASTQERGDVRKYVVWIRGVGSFCSGVHTEI